MFFLFTNAFSQGNSSFQSDSIRERNYFHQGRTEYLKGDFEKAEEYFQKSLELTTKLYGKNSKNAIQSIINLGIQQKNLGEYDKAIQSYSKAERIFKEQYGKDDARIGIVYGNIGSILKIKGDYSKALEYQESALRAFNTNPSVFKDKIQSTEFNLAVSLKNLKRTDEAIEIATNNIKGNGSRLNPRYFDLLATIYKEQGELEKANRYYQKAIDSWEKIYGENYYGLCEEFSNYADLLVKIQEYDSAFDYNSKAEKIIKETFGEKSIYFSDVQNIFGDIYLNRDSKATTISDFNEKKIQNINTALSYYQKAAIAVLNNYDVESPYSLPPIDDAISEIQLLSVLKKKANAFELMARIHQSEMDYDNYQHFSLLALHTINNCTNLIHKLRVGYLTEESKLLLAEKQDATFKEAISIASQLYKFTKDKQYLKLAYEFTEKSKSASFLASLKDIEAKEFGGIPDSLLAKEQYLKINLSNYKELLFQEKQKENPDTQKTNLYSSKIFHHNEAYNQLINLFEEKYPRYYSFKYENKVISIDEIQRKISTRDAVIEYVIKEPEDSIHSGKLYLFTITKDNVDLNVEEFDIHNIREIEDVQKFLSAPNYLFTQQKDFELYCEAAYNLYTKLISPVANKIAGKHLTIIPDDKLAYIPFDALISESASSQKMDFRKLKYLVYDYPINYSYSSTLLFNFFETKKHRSKRLIAFAPDYNTPGAGNNLLALPGAKKEVGLLNEYISSDVYTDSMATEAKFKALAPDYDILHLAMHTIINDSLPMFSQLVFSQSGDEGKEDGLLNTQEIYNMKLNARMAVLSACNTGNGKLQKGEGVMSLARGFLYAGCPSIVMTLWEVEDLSGTEIMQSFYQFIAKGKNKDEALRLAKLKHIRHADQLKAHPHYWLGYVTVGNPEALHQSNDIYFVLIISILIVLILADQIYRTRKRRIQK